MQKYVISFAITYYNGYVIFVLNALCVYLENTQQHVPQLSAVWVYLVTLYSCNVEYGSNLSFFFHGFWWCDVRTEVRLEWISVGYDGEEKESVY